MSHGLGSHRQGTPPVQPSAGEARDLALAKLAGAHTVTRAMLTGDRTWCTSDVAWALSGLLESVSGHLMVAEAAA